MQRIYIVSMVNNDNVLINRSAYVVLSFLSTKNHICLHLHYSIECSKVIIESKRCLVYNFNNAYTDQTNMKLLASRYAGRYVSQV